MNVQCRVLIEKTYNGFYGSINVKDIIKYLIKHTRVYYLYRYDLKGMKNHISIKLYTLKAIHRKKECAVLDDEFEYPFKYRHQLGDVCPIKLGYYAAMRSGDDIQLKKPFCGCYEPLIISPMYLSSSFFRVERRSFALYGKRVIKLEMRMDQEIWTPGRCGIVHYHINNKSNVDILCLKVDFLCYTTVIYNASTLRHVTLHSRTINEGNPWSKKRIPAGAEVALSGRYLIPPEVKHELIEGKSFRRYVFKVRMMLPSPYCDITTKIPVLYSKKKYFHRNDPLESQFNRDVDDFCARMSAVFVSPKDDRQGAKSMYF